MSYQSVITADGATAAWPMNDVSGHLTDVIGTGSTTSETALTYGVTGPVTGMTAVSWNGSTSQSSAPSNSAFNAVDGPMSVELWFKRGGGVGVLQELLDRGHTTGNAWVMFIDAANALRFNDSSAASDMLQTNIAISDTTTWHHAVATKNGTARKIYLDSVDVTDATGANVTLSNSTSALGIGKTNFNGAMAWVALYNVVLTPTQVAAHYAAATSVSTPTWVSPVDTAALGLNPILQFTSPTSTNAQHFELQLDTANTFDTGNLRDLITNTSQTGWTYFDGSSWVAFPSSGLPAVKSGNDVRYAVDPALTMTTWYRRVRAGS